MWTEKDEKEYIRLTQKRERNMNSNRRNAMLRWNRSDKYKIVKSRYMDNGGREKMREGRKLGTDNYRKIIAYRHSTYEHAHKRRQRWTGSDDKKLQDLYLSGKTSKELSVILERSLRGIERRIARLGIKKKDSKIL